MEGEQVRRKESKKVKHLSCRSPTMLIIVNSPEANSLTRTMLYIPIRV